MKMKFLILIPLFGLLSAGCVTRTYTVATPTPGPTIAEVQSLLQAHVADSVIVNQIQNSSTRYRLTADQIIALKNAGASDNVLNALINSAGKAAPQTTTTTVVQSYPYVYPYPYVYVDPWPFFWWGWGPHYHHWR